MPKRGAFLDELVQLATRADPGAGVALSVLESEAMPGHIRSICKHITPLPPVGSTAEESILVAFLRVVAADRSAQYLHLVEHYLLTRGLNPYWESLPWSLWAHYAELFCRAWAWYFSAVPASRWRGTAVVQAFLTHPDAIACLKRELLSTSADAWTQLHDAIEAEAEAPWLNQAQRDLLHASIGA
jgi:hypothetical protein